MTNVLPILGLNGVELLYCSHSSRSEGVCAMEAVAWLAGEPHSDAPQCACPALSAFVRTLNDCLNDADRQKLKPVLTKLIGTRGGNEQKRVELLAHRSVTVFAASAMEKAGLVEEAAKLRAVPVGDMKAAELTARAAWAAARSAKSAAWLVGAARSAAESAARLAEGAAARAALSAAYAGCVDEAVAALEDAIKV